MTNGSQATMQQRLDCARRQLRARNLDALLIGPGADLRWAVGYAAHASERLTMLVVPAHGEVILVVPELEAPLAVTAGVDEHAEIRTWDEVADPVAMVVDALGGRPDNPGATIAVDDRLWSQFTLTLQAQLPDVTFQLASAVTGPLRLVKDRNEVAALHAAGAAIDAVHAEVAGLLVPGRTEAEVAGDIDRLIRQTHDETSFIIVASGPNGASPHHTSADRQLQRGDAVVVDIGGTLEGYGSDSTRNYVLGHVSPRYQQLHDVLQEAQAAATAAARPGVTAAAIDAAARDVITAGGHGDHFIHRTGHGIGLDGHEPPWIVAGNEQVMEPGMAFSIEPGIYVPDHFGARIEDIVVLDDDGAASVNHRPREIVVA